ncbi:MAG: nucleotidyltransferase domain-containing protein [Chloroflexi bacterium]|nr:nucleotidyltransferase domain-containing protein [Chloroflexota bacterium]
MKDEDARELARLIERLVAALAPERVYVFGSQARGDATPESDFDLLVVVPESKEPTYRLAQTAYRAMGRRNLSVDVLVMAREEFERRSRAVASLPATVLREGKMLYAA